MIFRRSFTSALLIGAVFVLLPASPAYGDLIVNGTSVEDDNGLAGIQRATTIQVSWNPNQFVSYPDDTCLNTKRFANLQSALYAINQGLVTDRRILLRDNTIPGTGVGLPPGVPRNIEIRKSGVEITAAPGFNPIVRGGQNVISIYSRLITLKGFEICDGTGAGIDFRPGVGPLVISTRADLDLIDMHIHDNDGHGIYAYHNLPQNMRVDLFNCRVITNGRWGILGIQRVNVRLLQDVEIIGNGHGGSGGFGGVSLSNNSHLQTTGRYTASTSTVAGIVRSIKFHNNGGHSIHIGNNGSVNLSFTEITHSTYNGLNCRNQVQVLVEDSLIEHNHQMGIRLENPLSPTIRRTEVSTSTHGGIRVVNPRLTPGTTTTAGASGRVTLTNLNVHNNGTWGMYLTKAGGSMQQCTIANNFRQAGAASGGFGVWSEELSGFVMNDVDIEDNADTGFVTRDTNSVTLRDTRINGNRRHGISTENSTLLIERNSAITGNQEVGIYARTGCDVTIHGCEIKANGDDGISLEDADLTIDQNCEIALNLESGISAEDNSIISVIDSEIETNGRDGIYTDESDLYLENVDIFDNLENGLYADENSTIEVENCTFENNLQRGIIFADGTNGDIKNNCVIRDNMMNGIMIRECPGLVVIEGCKIYNNFSIGVGGGIFVWNNSNPTICDNKIFDNAATGNGGGISIINARATIGEVGKKNKITNNTSIDGIGGGISCNDTTGQTLIVANDISDNKATGTNAAHPGRGGGIGIRNGQGIEIRGNDIMDNTATHAGGGIHINNSNVKLGGPANTDTNVLTLNKVTAGDGGGISLWRSFSTVENNRILGNEALGAPLGRGGGVACKTGYDGTLQNNQIVDNKALRGGGIFIYQANPTIGGQGGANTITQNTASERARFGNAMMMGIGGGIYSLDSDLRTVIDGNTIGSNHGVGIFLDGGRQDQIAGNFIGVDSNLAAMPNKGHGIVIRNGTDHTIGKTNLHQKPNLIWNYASGTGVAVGGITALKNKITKDNIYNNMDMGILHYDGGNHELAGPIFTQKTTAVLNGSVSTAAPPGSQVEIFENRGAGVGLTYLETVPVAADQTFKATTGGYRNNGADILATVTHTDESTSEFGKAVLDLDIGTNNDATEMDNPGHFLQLNNDDDNGDGTDDMDNNIVDGVTDKLDMAELILRRLPRYLDDGTLTLSIQSIATTVRIFDQNDRARIGPTQGPGGTPETSYDIPWADIRSGDLTFHVESVDGGQTIVLLTYYDKNGNDVGFDSVMITSYRLDVDVNADQNPDLDVYLPGYNLAGNPVGTPTTLLQNIDLLIVGGENLTGLTVSIVAANTTSYAGFCLNSPTTGVYAAGQRDFVLRRGGADGASFANLSTDASGIVQNLKLRCRDYGGQTRVQVRKGPDILCDTTIPIDKDGDRISDVYERQQLVQWRAQYGLGAAFNVENLAFFGAATNRELADPDGAAGARVAHATVGDKTSVLEEYRSFLITGGGHNGAGAGGHAGGHIRLSAARKELLVEVDVRTAPVLPAGVTINNILNDACRAWSSTPRGCGIRVYYFLDQTNVTFGGAGDPWLVMPAGHAQPFMNAWVNLQRLRNRTLRQWSIHTVIGNNTPAWGIGLGSGGGYTWDTHLNHDRNGSLVFLVPAAAGGPVTRGMTMKTLAHEWMHMMFSVPAGGAWVAGEHLNDPDGDGHRWTPPAGPWVGGPVAGVADPQDQAALMNQRTHALQNALGTLWIAPPTQRAIDLANNPGTTP